MKYENMKVNLDALAEKTFTNFNIQSCNFFHRFFQKMLHETTTLIFPI